MKGRTAPVGTSEQVGAVRIGLYLLGLLLIGAAPPPVASPLLPVAIDGKWGYIDPTGRMVIAPRFSAAERFSEGLAATCDQGRWGFIDRTGTRMFALDGGEGSPAAFHDGRARVCHRDNSKCRAVDRDGKTVWQPHGAFSLTGDFEDGRARICDGLLHCGFIDLDGKEVEPPTYSTASAFSEGLAVVGTRGGFGFIDTQGRQRFSVDALDARPPHEGRAAFQGRVPHVPLAYGFLAADGSVAIAPRYCRVGDFSGGRAAFRQDDGRWGFLTLGGKMAIAPTFTVVSDFSEGLAAASEVGGDGFCLPQISPWDCPPEGKHRWGYLDPSGRWAIRPAFDEAGPFQEGVARVVVGGEWRYIDARGTILWPPVDQDLKGTSREELRRMRNEIYARHGYVFKDPALADFFRTQPWYQPDPAFTEDRLSDEEKARVELLLNSEKAAPR